MRYSGKNINSCFWKDQQYCCSHITSSPSSAHTTTPTPIVCQAASKLHVHTSSITLQSDSTFWKMDNVILSQGNQHVTNLQKFMNCPLCDLAGPQEYFNWNVQHYNIWPGEGTEAALLFFFLEDASTWLMIGCGSIPPRSKWHSKANRFLV